MNDSVKALAIGGTVGVCLSALAYKLFGRPRKYQVDFDKSQFTPRDDCKMVLVIRRDLKMDKGKVAAQCCHACLGVYRKAVKCALNGDTDVGDALAGWLTFGQTKVTLQVPGADELNNLFDLAVEAGAPATIITDAGRTQIPAGSQTVLAIGPWPVDEVDQITGRLKLY
ncbi:peptidyl-tRNA hydrolase 2, mitochondrial-like [Carpediemonas membranifera]|uniref:peptidyl-tRNA hydrolase n=1 Tax=Carpediemonas membranifera TaxID=201153 RepID=A0A8J6B4M3_9EUKA|nr:peptidyl-tRNA hydrolase 2, mitochondrial-like [Carpediemonas membranifera]|eukprot:KAG9392894.1 peptidyl-tRNA hydrolase 2, mitochondrial-like [Carpediemonas membranifera]